MQIMSLSIRKSAILNLLQQNPKLGKTAVMKAVFMLQQVKGIELGYDFSIYTYGPYASDVMADIDDLVEEGFISSTMYPYNNYIGYRLEVTKSGETEISVQPMDDESQALKDISDFIRGKSAKDLELYSTIIYIANLYTKNAWGVGEKPIVEKVKEIKPHFSTGDIQGAYQRLKAIKYI